MGGPRCLKSRLNGQEIVAPVLLVILHDSVNGSRQFHLPSPTCVHAQYEKPYTLGQSGKGVGGGGWGE